MRAKGTFSLSTERRAEIELASDGKDDTSPVRRGASGETLCLRVWRTPKLKNTSRNEDVLSI